MPKRKKPQHCSRRELARRRRNAEAAEGFALAARARMKPAQRPKRSRNAK